MTLEVLNREMVVAMKERNKLKKDTISSLISAVKKAAIDGKCKDNITEELVDKVILKEKKTVQEMIDTCPADRVETLREYKTIMTIIDYFAPQMMSEEEIRNVIELNLDELKSHNMEISPKIKGLVMKAVAPVLKGKADMGMVNKILSEMLS